jgi:hypothetical protein
MKFHFCLCLYLDGAGMAEASLRCLELFNVKYQAFEVFPFGMADVYRMVGGLRQLVQDSDFAFALNCCREHR